MGVGQQRRRRGLPEGFAVIRGGCRLGKIHYPQAKALTLTTDRGDSHDTNVRLWKCELRRFVNETGVSITVVNLPPGTSKWNRIEHQMFAFISQNWAPLTAGEPSGDRPTDRRPHDQHWPYRYA